MEKHTEELYKRISERVLNLIEANIDAIEREFEANRKIVEDPSRLVFPIKIQMDLCRVGKITNHKESIAWEVKKKEKIETDEENFDPDQPGLPFNPEE